MADSCEHLNGLSAGDFAEPTTDGACEDCLIEGTPWVELRACKTCGHVGCCDSSVSTHATKHFKATQHPVIRSAMPGDKWTWCYVDEATGSV